MKLQHLTAVDRRHLAQLSLSKKKAYADKIIADLLKNQPLDRISVAWTGGKDSTLLVWMMRAVAQKLSLPLPQLVCIDEGDMFPEVNQFIDQLSSDWELKLERVKNDDVLSQVKQLGDRVIVKKLNPVNQAAVAEVAPGTNSFSWQPESLIGNHLMKTMPLRQYLQARQFKFLVTGVRWDEQAARSQDDFWSPRSEPDHTRVEPLLHLTEADVWQLIQRGDIPVVSLYADGYRSLGAKSSTSKAAAVPAWEQDLESTSERAGRQQDKEKIMQKLRQLGYM